MNNYKLTTYLQLTDVESKNRLKILLQVKCIYSDKLMYMLSSNLTQAPSVECSKEVFENVSLTMNFVGPIKTLSLLENQLLFSWYQYCFCPHQWLIQDIGLFLPSDHELFSLFFFSFLLFKILFWTFRCYLLFPFSWLELFFIIH